MSRQAPPAGPRDAELIEWQLRSVPVLNAAVRRETDKDGRPLLVAPLAHRRWSRLLRRVLPIRDAKRLALDPLSLETLDLFDGGRTVAEIVDHFQERWHLSFFEARGMVLEFLKRLVRDRVVILNAPAER
jgi:hypothetical protein